MAGARQDRQEQGEPGRTPVAGPEAAIENRGWAKRLTAYAWRHPKDVIL
ncbi:hypothetical protein ACWIGN_31115 [Streptomyces albidoflavus]